MREIGVSIAIDDFGTGYSSLAYLKNLPIDYLKIDRVFVKDIVEDKNDAAIANSIITLAHNLGMEVIAEGVEDITVLGVLQAFGCDHYQGFYFSRPVDPEEIPKLLSTIRKSGADLVYGIYKQKKHAAWRNVGSVLVRGFYKLVLKVSHEPTSFRIIKSKLLKSILSYNKNFTYVDGLLTWNTQRIGATEVEHHARLNGKSGYSISRLVVLSLNLFTNFSLIPLQLVSVWGMFVAVVGLMFGGYFLLQSLLSNIAVSGYASTIVAILVLGRKVGLSADHQFNDFIMGRF